MTGATFRTSFPQVKSADSTFENHYTIADLAGQSRLGRETVRLLVKDEGCSADENLGPKG